MGFQLNIDDESDSRTHTKKSEFSEKNNPKTLPRFNWTPSARDTGTRSTLQIDFSTHSRYVDKPSWGPTNRERT